MIPLPHAPTRPDRPEMHMDELFRYYAEIDERRRRRWRLIGRFDLSRLARMVTPVGVQRAVVARPDPEGRAT